VEVNSGGYLPSRASGEVNIHHYSPTPIICILPCVTQFRCEKLGTLLVSKSEESINGVTHKLGRHCFEVIFSRSSHNLLTGSLGGRELFSGQWQVEERSDKVEIRIKLCESLNLDRATRLYYIFDASEQALRDWSHNGEPLSIFECCEFRVTLYECS